MKVIIGSNRKIAIFIVLVALITVLGGCGNDDTTPPTCDPVPTPPPSVTPDIIVSASSGNDSLADGVTCAYKTITAALAAATSGNTVWAAPGTYDTALGEVFPIIIPASVSLIGDEANKGNGTVTTEILGNGLLYTGVEATIEPLANATVAGFILTANTAGANAEATVIVRNDGVTLRNNSLINSVYYSVYITNGSQNHIITGNLIQNNAWLGLGFVAGGVGTKVENNIITGNLYGVVYQPSGGDLGGGSAGSAGGNTISCNSTNDLWTEETSALTINAANNYWDHAPPSGNDIYNPNGANIVTTSAQVAASNCP